MKSLAVLSLVTVAAFGHTAIMWDESISGDLTGNHLVPQVVTVGLGSNELIGSTGESDRDYFTFSLQSGWALTGIVLTSYVSNDDISFLAVQEGTFITEDPESPAVGNLLGWTFFGGPEVGTDILPAMGSNWGSIGFTPPLTGSNYAFWLQQTGDLTDYRLDFQVQAVPEPATILATTALFGALLRKRKRQA